MMRFSDVLVEPPTGMHREFAVGGPAWPDFDTQVLPRMCRDGVPKDRSPVPDPSGCEPEELAGPHVWGGHVYTHFGHFVAECASRLPQSLAERPDDPVLLLLPPDMTAETVPGYVLDVCAWLGLPRDRIRFVDARTRLLCRELRVVVQAEQLHQVGGPSDYVSMLDAIARRNRLDPEPTALVYVGRGGITRRYGHHGGERYLEDCLRRLGIRVFHPEQHPLREQLRVLAGAKHLIFAEGSALHARQLLGRVAGQRVTVLSRRPGLRVARAALQARGIEATYAEVMAGTLAMRNPTGSVQWSRAVALFDVDALHGALAAVGIDIAPVWRPASYRRELVADVADWFEGAALYNGLDEARSHRARLESEAASAGHGFLVGALRRGLWNAALRGSGALPARTLVRLRARFAPLP
jgi:hypothetical protein